MLFLKVLSTYSETKFIARLLKNNNFLEGCSAASL
jgi:hypothetical protein